jgi:hypothetical protein
MKQKKEMRTPTRLYEQATEGQERKKGHANEEPADETALAPER